MAAGAVLAAETAARVDADASSPLRMALTNSVPAASCGPHSHKMRSSAGRPTLKLLTTAERSVASVAAAMTLGVGT